MEPTGETRKEIMEGSKTRIVLYFSDQSKTDWT
jgi:hypothetical protein